MSSAWIAEILSIDKQADQPINIRARVQLRNTVTNEVLPFDMTGNDLATDSIALQAALRVQSTLVRDAALPLLAPGQLTLPDLTPTQAQLDKQAFDVAVRRYANMRAFLPAGHPDIDTAQQAMLALYKKEYFGL